MDLKIFLDGDSYNFFLRHLPYRAMGRASIEKAVLMGRTRIVECDRSEANELLLQAVGSCPEAVVRITEALALRE